MLSSSESKVIYKVQQLGFDRKTVENVKKYFHHEIKKQDEREVRQLVQFIQEVLVTH